MLTIHADNLLVPMNERGGEKIKNFSHVLFFIVLQILVVTKYIVSPKGALDIFWFCNHVAILYAFAFYTHRPQMAIGIMQVGIFIQAMWIVGFISHVTGIGSMTVADYMFEGSVDYAKLVTFVIHVLLPISSVWLLRREKPQLISLAYSLVYGAILYISALMGTPRTRNINCVFSPCTSLLPGRGYTVLWPLYMGSMVLSTHWIYRIIFYWTHQKQGRPRIHYLATS